jgi:hypothetical protein
MCVCGGGIIIKNDIFIHFLTRQYGGAVAILRFIVRFLVKVRHGEDILNEIFLSWPTTSRQKLRKYIIAISLVS